MRVGGERSASDRERRSTLVMVVEADFEEDAG